MARFVRIGADQVMVGLDGEAGCPGRNQEGRRTVVHRHVRVGDGDHDEERSDRGVGGEEFLPGDHPVVAVADRTGGEDARICAALGFGHGEAGEDLSGQQTGQVPVLLFLGAEAGQDLCVAGVGCLGPEDDRRPRAAAQNLVDQCQFHRAETLPAEFRAEMRCPQPLFAYLLFERIDDAAALVVQWQEFATGEQHLERFHLFAHEIAHPLEFLLKFRLGGEVPCHRIAPDC